VEQAFELTDASAERSAAGCSVQLDKAPIVEYMRSNITLMKWMIAERLRRQAHPRPPHQGHGSVDRQGPELLKADAGAEYAAVIEIDLADVKEPIVACPNDPDDVKLLSEVAGEKIDEVFIGSCMTNIGHFRAAGKVLEGKTDIPTRLWVAPPTKMDAMILNEEGYYAILGKSGARMEMPGCSLCMGNQAQIRKGSTAMSTSTRNFPNRLGIDTRVYLGSAELASICALMGKHPDRRRVHGAGQGGECQGRRCLSLHELRPDRRVQGRGGYGDGVSVYRQAEKDNAPVGSVKSEWPGRLIWNSQWPPWLVTQYSIRLTAWRGP
jgi:aconitate hydratase 2/2-methylisocitrate dehydratase